MCLSFFLLLPLAIGTGLVLKSGDMLTGHSLGSLIFSADWSPDENKFGFWPFILSFQFFSRGVFSILSIATKSEIPVIG